MTRDEVLNFAKSCGYWSGETIEMNDVGIERFARFIAEQEREECADAARNAPIKTARQDTRDACANAIMARGLTDK